MLRRYLFFCRNFEEYRKKMIILHNLQLLFSCCSKITEKKDFAVQVSSVEDQ